MVVRKAEKEEWEEAMALAWRVFQKYDAPDYTEEGIDSFLNFISDNSLYKMFLAGEYVLFVAESGGKIIGIISLRMGKHISLLFVDEKYQRIGAGKKLVNYLENYLANELGVYQCSVNAAPGAIAFYEKIGFESIGPMEISDGITYMPMIKNIN